jgi:hypothetical protein
MTTDNVLKFDLSPQRARQLLQEIAADSAKVVFTAHAEQRLKQRRISKMQALKCLRQGTMVEGPARDIKGNWKITLQVLSAGSPIKVVAALDYNAEKGNYAIVITAFS